MQAILKSNPNNTAEVVALLSRSKDKNMKEELLHVNYGVHSFMERFDYMLYDLGIASDFAPFLAILRESLLQDTTS